MLIYNAKVRTMCGKDFENGFIQIEHGKITSVGDMSNCPQSQQRFDACGAIAMPGLIDAHCHIGMWEDGLGFEGDDGNEDTDPCTPHLRGMDGVNPFDRSFSEALDYGVTTVVTGPGSANPIAGQMCAMKTYGHRIDKMLIREPLAIKIAMGENPKNSYHEKDQGPATRMAIAAIIREQLSKAKQYAKQCQQAAEDDEIDEPDFDAKCEALMPLLNHKIKAHIHAHRADDIFTAMRIAKEFDYEYVIVHGTEGHMVAEDLAEEGVSVLAGPLIGSRTKPELVNSKLSGVGELEKSGVRVAITTDHPEVPCQFLLMSAQLAAQEGMERNAALRAVTSQAAAIVGIDDRVGALRAGLDGDVILFKNDPLATGSKPLAVFVNGEQVRGSK